MSDAAWLQAGVLIVLIGVGTRLLGLYLAAVYGGGAAPGDRVFLPVERTQRVLRTIDRLNLAVPRHLWNCPGPPCRDEAVDDASRSQRPSPLTSRRHSDPRRVTRNALGSLIQVNRLAIQRVKAITGR